MSVNIGVVFCRLAWLDSPIAERGPSSVAVSQPSPPQKKEEPVARILLVDDNTAILIPLEQFLTDIEHEVVGKAASAEEGLAMARGLNPDLVVMDINMPGEMDGIDAAGIMKADLKIPTIFITGHARRDYFDRAQHLDPLGFILKPFRMGEVRAVIELALNRTQGRRYPLA